MPTNIATSTPIILTGNLFISQITKIIVVIYPCGYEADEYFSFIVEKYNEKVKESLTSN